MADFSRQIALADRLIRQYGKTVTWRKFVAGTGGTDASPAPSVPEDNLNVPVVFLASKGVNQLATALMAMAGSEVPTSGIKALMPGNVSFDPELTDIIIDGVKVYNLDPKNGIDILAPDGTPILYFLRFIR